MINYDWWQSLGSDIGRFSERKMKQEIKQWNCLKKMARPRYWQPEQFSSTDHPVSVVSRGQNGPPVPHIKVFSCVLRTQNSRAKKYKTVEWCRTLSHLPTDKNHRAERVLGPCAFLHTYTVIFILVKVLLCWTCY